ncbi:type II toxin-antitoxin system VapC family toxin [Natronobiforma cellulositropha]|uniref:type II toxin-antitoxin system VapC family toxin n=1 Tax=Natronobiforma cellulositropha TaxID=1679076 RepID=UPI0021D5A96D|nr:type II toxin-antitoxin system VapC family toxin [Natronobiforma cellulositropha]
MTDLETFSPASPGTTALFVDSSALFAAFHTRDECHESVRSFLDGIRDGRLPYRRLYTNDYVLDETVTRLRYRVSHDRAVTALETVHSSAVFRFELVDEEVYEAGRSIFETYDDQQLSLTDATIVAHMDRLGLDHVLTYDSDFRAFECTVLPHTR